MSAQYIVNDAFKKITLEIPDITVSGPIGTAYETVDHYSSFVIYQTTPDLTLTLPTPTDTTWGDDVTIRNIGTEVFYMYDVRVPPDSFDIHLTWKFGEWRPVGGYGTQAAGGPGGSDCCCDTILFFKNDTVASVSGGLIQGNYYLTDDSNSYGMAWGMVKSLVESVPFTGAPVPACVMNIGTTMLNFYISDSAAKTGGLNVGDYYLLDTGNLYAMASGMIKKITEP